MPTSTTKKVLAEFAWNDYQTPESTTKKVLAEFAWNDYQVPTAEAKKLLVEFAWGDFTPSSGGRPILPQSTPSEYISDDYTVNTFAIDRLSSQYTRKTEQVPFSMCMRGPGSVRGRDKDSPYRPDVGRRRRGRRKKRKKNQE